MKILSLVKKNMSAQVNSMMKQDKSSTVETVKLIQISASSQDRVIGTLLPETNTNQEKYIKLVYKTMQDSDPRETGIYKMSSIIFQIT